MSGTLRVGDEELALRRAAGQRDHSWGTRDWWSMDWVWSAGHLDDGTRFHARRAPAARTCRRLGVGYVQPAERRGERADAVGPTEEVGDDGLIDAAR